MIRKGVHDAVNKSGASVAKQAKKVAELA